MTDMGPRRMDGFGGVRPVQRPAGPATAGQRAPQPAAQRPAPQPMPASQRSVQSQPRPVQPRPQPRPAAPAGYAQQPGYRQPQSAYSQSQSRQVQSRQQVQSAPASEAKPVKTGGTWKVIVQFVAGLLVIAGVAAAIVYLYTKYYSQ